MMLSPLWALSEKERKKRRQSNLTYWHEVFIDIIKTMNISKPIVELSFDSKRVPKSGSVEWFDVSYRWAISGMHAYKEGEIVFSTPEISSKKLFSRWYRTCLALAWINEETQQKVLAHICPGGYYPDNARRFGTTYMREYQHEIEENLKIWRDECGITNGNMGMAGSCIFPSSKEGTQAYLDTIKWMWDRLAAILPGDPQILGLPSKGYGNEQHISISDRILIVRQLGFISGKITKSHIPYKQIGWIIGEFVK